MAINLRKMYLKHCYNLGYESLVKEVEDSLRAVTTDRGFYSQTNEKRLHNGGVKRVSIPIRDKASPKSKPKRQLAYYLAPEPNIAGRSSWSMPAATEAG